MIDPFVLLTPVLLLAVLALLGFVGCDIIFGLNTVVPPPDLVPPPSSYLTPQLVGITNQAVGADIYYTTDGSTPTSSQSGTTQKYSQQILISTTTVIKAIASLDSTDSGVFTGTYYIGPILFQQLTERAESLNNNSVTTKPFTADVNSGNLMVVWIWYASKVQQVSSVTDSKNNSYQLAAGPKTGISGMSANNRQEIWYANNITGGSSISITAIFSADFSGEKVICAHEYSGADSVQPFEDVKSEASDITANATTGAVPQKSARLIFGGAVFSPSGSFGPGFNPRYMINGNITEDRPAVEGGMGEATFVNPAESWIAQMVAFK
jgi:hypothetical protein